MYLVTTEDGVKLTTKKPRGVMLLNDGENWKFRSFVMTVGGDVGKFLYSSDWIGPVGVYDVSKPEHLASMMKQALAHDRAITARIVKRKIADAIDPQSRLEADSHNFLPPIQRKRLKPLTAEQRLYLIVEDIVNKAGYRYISSEVCE